MKTINIQNTIDIKFWDRIAIFDDVKVIEGIEEDKNAFYNEETKARYFTFDAIEKIQKAYDDGKITFRVPTIEERKQAVDIAAGYKALRNKLQLPYNGVRDFSGGRCTVGTASSVWSSTPHDDNHAYVVWFDPGGYGYPHWAGQYHARSLIFLQD